jgi:hypothetical protein
VTKGYVVLTNISEMVYPIKAAVNPHNRRVPIYCPGQPQFFGGGKDEPEETPRDALRREVKEESSETYELFQTTGNPVLEDSYRHRGVDFPCAFYYSTQYLRTGRWPMRLEEWQAKLPKYREMCWVARIARDRFHLNMNDEDISYVLLENARRDPEAPQWAKDQMATGLSRQYRESLYFRAFPQFVRLWLTRPLSP